MAFQVLTGLAGGLGLFLFGMRLTSEGLQKLGAQRTRALISRLTDNRFLGVLVGIGLTFLMQSSGAVSVLLIGFVSASLVSLDQALGIVLGSAVGSTLAVQLFAFELANFAWWMIAAGASLGFSKRPRHRQLAEVSLGFGLIFLSLGRMSSVAIPLKESLGFVNFLVRLTESPVVTVLISAALASLIHSAATIALAMSLVESGLLSFSAALYVIYGANIGTTITAVVSSLGSKLEAKRVAVANLLFKVLGVLLVFPFSEPFMSLMSKLSSDPSRMLANAHTAFNLVILLAFIPFTGQFTKMVRWLIPGDEEIASKPRFLDTQFLSSPELALHQAKKEIQRMADTIDQSMFPYVMPVLKYGTPSVAMNLEEHENTIDELSRAVTKYLAELSETNLTSEQSEKQVSLLYVCNDLEHVADIITSLIDVSEKIHGRKLELSDAGWSEIEDMLRRVEERFRQAITAFRDDDNEQAVEVITQHPNVLRAEKDMRYSHFSRVVDENLRSLETSAVHLDITNSLLRIDTHVVSMAQSVIGII